MLPLGLCGPDDSDASFSESDDDLETELAETEGVDGGQLEGLSGGHGNHSSTGTGIGTGTGAGRMDNRSSGEHGAAGMEGSSGSSLFPDLEIGVAGGSSGSNRAGARAEAKAGSKPKIAWADAAL